MREGGARRAGIRLEPGGGVGAARGLVLYFQGGRMPAGYRLIDRVRRSVGRELEGAEQQPAPTLSTTKTFFSRTSSSSHKIVVSAPPFSCLRQYICLP